MLNDLESLLGKLTPEERDAVTSQALTATQDRKWTPNPGPQTEAYFSKAQILLYGGAGGGGKSDLLIGLALEEHRRSLLMRRQYTDLAALTERLIEVYGTRKGFNGQPPPSLRTVDERLVRFGAVNRPENWQSFQGQPHDLLGFDEACQFPEQTVRTLLGWNRSADADLDSPSQQRVRAVLATNPPLSAEGDWIIGMFRPWLDVTHENPAEHGDLRWFLTDPDGKDIEAEGPDDIREWGGKTYRPQSRTFIPAALEDNPFLVNTGYQATLDAMPEPMRSAIRDGNFMAAREDDEWQVIPTGWVLAANQRWREQEKPVNGAMTALGLDPARGGRDETVLHPRFGRWFDPQIAVPGRETPDGPSVLALVVREIRDGAPVGYDPIGIGSAVTDALAKSGLDYEDLNGSSRSEAMTRDGSFGFVTFRTEMWWNLREALDPDYGMDLAIPPDARLQADLTAPRYTVRPGDPPKIYVEAKEDTVKRLGRSPDRGDACVYAWNTGGLEAKPRANRHSHEQRAQMAGGGPTQPYSPNKYRSRG